MGHTISFSLRFSADVQPVYLLQELIRAEFDNFFRPKVGRLNVGGTLFDFGRTSYAEAFDTNPLVGEQVVAPSLTTLNGSPNAAPEITAFLAPVPTSKKMAAELLGDWRLNYAEGSENREDWLFRYSDDRLRSDILVCHLHVWPMRDDYRTTHLSFVSPFPWFFHNDWPLGMLPRYSTRETTESNWNRLITLVLLAIKIAGEDRLRETALSFERIRADEERWLIDKAQCLPNLQINFS